MVGADTGRARLALAIVGAALCVACRGSREPEAAAHGANLVLFLVDTLRADRLGCYGYPRPVSPNLDAFAADAVLFERAVAQSSWTRPAMVSVFTGLVPQEHGVNGRVDRLPAGTTTLAEMLADAGYENAAFVANANMAKRFGVAQGFSSYRLMWRSEVRDAPIVERGIEWLDRRAEPKRPFFLYLHLVEPHAPYRPSPEIEERFATARAPVAEPPSRPFMKRLGSGQVTVTPEIVGWLGDLYDGEVAAADAAFGLLVEKLRERELYDDTVVVVLSDHGEELYEHGRWEHGKTLYGEVVNVPMLLRLPRGPRGLRVAAPVQQVDLFPTLLAALAVEGGATRRARSLLPLLRPEGDAPASETPLLSLLAVDGLHVEAATDGRWRLIREHRPTGSTVELYDVRADPGETRDMAASEPETVTRLTARLDAAADEGSAAAPQPEAALIDRKLERRLRALGYM
jgi:arylsulfatase A-like enzyme